MNESWGIWFKNGQLWFTNREGIVVRFESKEHAAAQVQNQTANSIDQPYIFDGIAMMMGPNGLPVRESELSNLLASGEYRTYPPMKDEA